MRCWALAGAGLLFLTLLVGCESNGGDGGGTPPTAAIAVTEGTRVNTGTTLRLSAAGSTAPDGTVARWQWQAQQPAGNGSTLQPDATSRDVTFVANVAGTYTFTLEVWDDGDRKSEAVTAQVTVVAPGTAAIRVRVTWVTPNDPDETDTGPEAGSDMDLHFLHPSAPANQERDVDGDGQPDPYYDQPYDCFWFNPNPIWSPSSPASEGPNPRLERDDIDGGGPEIIALDSPPGSLIYQIAVHYWNDHGFGSAQPTVRVFIDDVEKFVDTAPSMQEHDLWKVAQLAWPSATITPYRQSGACVILHNYQNPDFQTASVRLSKR